jgi:stringent starvation protein B
MSEPARPPSSKKEALLALLDRGITMLHLDARRPDVVVPDYLTGEHHLRLNLSYRFYLPDLEIDDWGVRATLSFRGEGFHCLLPWAAIFAMTQEGAERGWLWPQDLPPELMEAIAREEARPKLRLVPEESTPAKDPAPDAEARPARGPHLRLVK